MITNYNLPMIYIRADCIDILYFYIFQGLQIRLPKTESSLDIRLTDNTLRKSLNRILVLKYLVYVVSHRVPSN